MAVWKGEMELESVAEEGRESLRDACRETGDSQLPSATEHIIAIYYLY